MYNSCHFPFKGGERTVPGDSVQHPDTQGLGDKGQVGPACLDTARRRRAHRPQVRGPQTARGLGPRIRGPCQRQGKGRQVPLHFHGAQRGLLSDGPASKYGVPHPCSRYHEVAQAEGRR